MPEPDRDPSLREYARRVHLALTHIDAHLDQPLDLASVAGVARFSAFHFHRLFSTWMGETFGDYLTRRRVEIAAGRLVANPRSSVTDIALGVGFGSPEAFARAFKRHFGCTPSAWRRDPETRHAHASTQSKLDQAPWLAGLHHEPSRAHTEDTPMQVKIVERAPVRIAYLRRTGAYGPGIGEFWRNEVYEWLNSAGLLGAPRYGIGHDDPSITAPEQCRYDAGVEVPEHFVATGAVQLATLPGGRYAALEFFGTPAEIPGAWAALLREWLPASGLQLDARPFFEFYPTTARHDPETGAFECEITIPVTSLR